jgi:hypothetical protein
MHTTQPEVPATAIVGNVIDLGEGRIAAIYRRDGMCWVAEFQSGRGRLIDVSSWFRSRGGALRHGHGRQAALETIAPITPELSGQIERLHRQGSAGDARVEQSPARVLSAFERWCVEMSRKLQGRVSGWSGPRVSLHASTTPRRP